MQLLSLDKEFRPLAYLHPINVQWNREYYQAGDFSVQILAKDYLPQMAYLYTPERPEMGILQKVELSSTIKGRFIQLSGFFLETILNDKIVYPTYYASGPVDTAVSQMVSTYKGDIPLLEVIPQSGRATATSWQETGGMLADVAYTQLQTQQMSFHCSYDYQKNRITFSTWQGLDRTQDQSANNFVVFSDGFRNLSSVKASLDSSNYKNYAVVGGQGEGAQRKIAYADRSDGGYKRQVFVDAKNERWDEEKQTESQYLEGLRQKGFEKLLDYQDTKNIEVDVTEQTFRYLEDFDLGDKVDVIVREIGVSMQARVISVHEVFKQNTHTVTVELGDKVMSLLQKARLGN